MFADPALLVECSRKATGFKRLKARDAISCLISSCCQRPPQSGHFGVGAISQVGVGKFRPFRPMQPA